MRINVSNWINFEFERFDDDDKSWDFDSIGRSMNVAAWLQVLNEKKFVQALSRSEILFR